MADELAWQRRFARRVTEEGGYGKKWSSTYAVGVPDLILGTPEIGLFVAEAKLEKDWNMETKRTLALTDKQILELHRIAEGGGTTSILVFLEQTPRECYVNLFPRPQIRDRLTLSRTDMITGAFKWQQKEGLLPWLNKRVSLIQTLMQS